MTTSPLHAYVGPEAIRAQAIGATTGTPIRARDDLATWLRAHADEREADGTPATYVVVLESADDLADGRAVLRLASRRSEHVACAGGQPVLAAGELIFDGARVVAASNLSTGYCPRVESWAAVRDALDRAGVPHPPAFTHAFEFRRCPRCGERNLVKDDYFVCAICDAELPAHWNF